MLEDGGYRVEVPEQAALLTVAWRLLAWTTGRHWVQDVAAAV